jgi:hypothetical protein
VPARTVPAAGVASPTAVANSVLLPEPFGPSTATNAPRGTSVSGWESGAWGPVVFFLALGSLALAVTRLLGIRVSLPLPHPTIHEGVGWVAILAVLTVLGRRRQAKAAAARAA